ncbi:MAG: hypothetical protein KKA07_05115 [Bacteroidetes bacterium]|nr:hypothetical protein [Bacteroidota bacterium]
MELYIFEKNEYLTIKLFDPPISRCSKGLRGSDFELLTDSSFIFEQQDWDIFKVDLLKTHIVLVNDSGKIIDRLYTARIGENITSISLSSDRKKLLFTSYVVPDTVSDENLIDYSLSGPETLTLIDLSTKQILTRIDTFYCHKNSTSFTNRALSPDYSSVLYAIINNVTFVVHLEDGKSEQTYQNSCKKPDGLYIRNIKTGEDSLFVAWADNGAWSGDSKYISYKMWNTILLWDCSTKEHSKLFTPEEGARLVEYRWSQDSKYILAIIQKKGNFLCRLIDVSDKKVTEVINPGISRKYHLFSWTY